MRVAPLGLPAAAHSAVQPPHGAHETRVVAASELCTDSGHIEPRQPFVHVDSGCMRAVIAGDSSPSAELEFTYRGPSTQTVPFASGEVRSQIGLKLRAKDTCNIVYVMWYATPGKGVHVAVKNNRGQSTHAECVDRGYIAVAPEWSTPLPVIQLGEKRVLRADIEGHVITVHVDGALAWKGTLPSEAFTFDGPVGIRSDNGIFDFNLRVAQPHHEGAHCAKR